MKRKASQINCSLAPLWGIDGTAIYIVPPAVPTLRQRGLRMVGVAAALLLWLTTASAQITLNGNLLTDAEKPVPDTRVGVAAGPLNTTDSKGQFSIKLSLDFIEGERVILVVDKPNWVINYPLDGEWNLPAKKLQEVPTQYTKVIIVPFGSKALWTHARIEKHIALLSDKIAELKKEDNTPKPVDFSLYLSEWADKYGFTKDQVKTAFDLWANAVKDSTDKRTQGLREFYEKNFAKAAVFFEEAALEDEVDLKEIADALRQKTLRAYANWKDAGNSLYNLYNFTEALSKYEKASILVSKEKLAKEWAEIRVFIGIVKAAIGARIAETQAIAILRESERSYREALEVYTREKLPQDWAKTQNNLGVTLYELGIRSDGEESIRLLAEAISLHREAMAVRTYQQMPYDWGVSQINLGNALQSLGIRLEGSEGLNLLTESINAFQQVLVVHTREQFPQDWAKAQNNLGNTLSLLGISRGGDEGRELLSRAVSAYKQAQIVFTREQTPQVWVTIQNNLGSALQEEAKLVNDERSDSLLNEAIDVYRQVLTVFTRDQLPQTWADTQNGLGNTLQELGCRTEGRESINLLTEAVIAYESALLVFDRDALPQDWAVTKTNLGSAFKELAIRLRGEEKTKTLHLALKAQEDALTVFTQEELPQDWALTQINLGAVFHELGIAATGSEKDTLLLDAVKIYKSALLVLKLEYDPAHWSIAQLGLANSYEQLHDWANAANSYANVLKVNQNDQKVYQILDSLYHEVLFSFDEAFALNQQWLNHLSKNFLVQSYFAEKHFTTSRFAECEQRLAGLLANAEIEPSTKIALRAIGIANALAQNKTQQIPTELEALQKAIAAQPDTFKVGWTFNGVKHFISTNETLAPPRAWLLQFFAALEREEGRDAILAGLQGARQNFKAAK